MANMKLTTILSTALALTASVAAAPHAAIKSRVCGQADAPDYMKSLQRFPDPHAGGTAGTDFFASQEFRDGALNNAFTQVVAFNGPFGAYGCQISLTFPEDIAGFYAATGLDGSGNPPTMNVFRISHAGLEDANTSYSDLVKQGGVFGTATVRPGTQVINTATCPTADEGGMAFLFEIPEWIHGSTKASWQNHVSGSNMANSVGVFVNYNC